MVHDQSRVSGGRLWWEWFGASSGGYWRVGSSSVVGQIVLGGRDLGKSGSRQIRLFGPLSDSSRGFFPRNCRLLMLRVGQKSGRIFKNLFAMEKTLVVCEQAESSLEESVRVRRWKKHRPIFIINNFLFL